LQPPLQWWRNQFDIEQVEDVPNINRRFQPKAEKWIAVARQLMADPASQLSCPFFVNAILKVIDAPTASGAYDGWISCQNCKEGTILHHS
jgi:hypothetical protein